MDDSEDVGYGKPPKAHQWSKGQSGNPKGRPRQSRDYITDYARILSEPMKAKQSDGRSIVLGGLEAAYMQLCKKALRGDNAALFSALKIMLEVLPDGQAFEQKQVSETEGAKDRLIAMVLNGGS